MQKLHQQLAYLQAELCARGGGNPSDEMQVYDLSYLRLFEVDWLFILL